MGCIHIFRCHLCCLELEWWWESWIPVISNLKKADSTCGKGGIQCSLKQTLQVNPLFSELVFPSFWNLHVNSNLYPQLLVQCLEQSRYSISLCWVNRQLNREVMNCSSLQKPLGLVFAEACHTLDPSQYPLSSIQPHSVAPWNVRSFPNKNKIYNLLIWGNTLDP